MLSVLSLLGLVSFLRQISLLLDCFCIDSMAMPRVWSLWAGLYFSSLLLASFLLVLGCSLVYFFFFYQYIAFY